MKKLILIVGLVMTLISGLTACSQANANASGKHQGNGMGNHQGRGGGMASNTALLQLLKIDAQTLQDDLKQGKTMVDIGKGQGVTEDQIVNLLVQQRIDNAKKQGKTQDEIDKSKTQWNDQVKKQIETSRTTSPNQKANSSLN